MEEPGGETHRRQPRAVREEQMLEAAGRVFAAHGFHRTSMDEIAEGVGLSKPMLYAYFGSKDGLYAAYIAREGRQLLQALDAVVRPDHSNPARLRAGASAFFAFVEERRDGWAVLQQELSGTASPVRAEVRDIRGRVTHRVATLTAPALRGESAEALAYAWVGAGESLANWWLEHERVPRDRLVEHLMALAAPLIDA